MTDRELLEAAAKAAGIDGEMEEDDIGFWIDRHLGKLWNPLTDDGDALRLAVKLGMRAPFELFMHVGGTDANFLAVTKAQTVHGMDHYAATRCAIVRAAAALTR